MPRRSPSSGSTARRSGSSRISSPTTRAVASSRAPTPSTGTRSRRCRRCRTGSRRTSPRCGRATPFTSEASWRRAGSERGSPNHGSALDSNRVSAQIRSPARVRTKTPVPWLSAGRGAQVGAERRLAVGPRRHEVEPPPRDEDALEEAGRDVPALVLERHRRHRHEHVVRQQRDQRSRDRRTRRRGRSASTIARSLARGEAARSAGTRCFESGTCPLERARDRLDGRVEHPGHLARAEPEDVAQDEDGDLARRQDLQGRHERQGDGLGLLVAGLRPERDIERPEQGVGVRLEPHDLAEPGRLGRLDPGDVPLPRRVDGWPRGAR